MEKYCRKVKKFFQSSIPGNEIENGNVENLIKIACHDDSGTPFPGFLCPLIQIMAYEYGNWRSKV